VRRLKLGLKGKGWREKIPRKATAVPYSGKTHLPSPRVLQGGGQESNFKKKGRGRIRPTKNKDLMIRGRGKVRRSRPDSPGSK